MRIICLFSFYLVGLIGFASGCGDPQQAKIASYRQALLLTTEPANAVSIEEARSNLDSQQNLVLIGKVGNKDIPQWWTEGKATLIISEGFPGSHYNVQPGHDPNTCPFCKRNWKPENAMAYIEFHNQQGELIPIDSRQLLDVQQDQVVVIRGTGQLDDDGFLQLKSDGVFIRKPE